MTPLERLDAAILCKVATAEAPSSGWDTADTITDFVPFAGGAKDIAKGIYSGWNGHPLMGFGQALMGAGSLALDTFTGGLGSTVAKGGIKALGHMAPKALVWGLAKTTGANAAASWGMNKLLGGNKAPPQAGEPTPAMDPTQMLAQGMSTGNIPGA